MPQFLSSAAVIRRENPSTETDPALSPDASLFTKLSWSGIAPTISGDSEGAVATLAGLPKVAYFGQTERVLTCR